MEFENMFPTIESEFDDIIDPSKSFDDTDDKDLDDDQVDDDASDDDTTDDIDSDEADEEGDDDIKVEYERHFKYMKENGFLFLPDDYKFDGDLEKAYELHFENMQKELAEEMVKNIPDQVKALVQYTMQGGKNVEEFIKTYSGSIDHDISTAEGQRAVIKDHLKTKGLSDKAIDKMLIAYETDDELEEIAKESKIALEKEKLAKQQAIITKEKEQAEIAKKQVKQFTDNVFNVIKEQTWDSKTKKDIYETIVDKNSPNYVYNKLKAVNSNPQHLIQLAQIMKGYDPKKGFDIEKVLGSGVENKKIKNKLESLFNDTKNLKTTKFSKNDSFDWDKISLFPEDN